ncbi:MAG: hypothetical protein CMJ38_01960 [Phycisphaerae bacterium]|jgi:hypothetical protein|nr:hypothetical protein [Phycisphaerae bacterium]HAU05708.1 hypothetical protein [Pseudoalteromonas shioyasakiensis]|tara:strand:- start:3835 stop:4425 length:591 start_codon:yes stop_codon:yes gene_type:complete
MESIISYVDAMSIERVYFIGLAICLFLNAVPRVRIPKVFHLAVIMIAFNALSHLWLFDFLKEQSAVYGVQFWVIGWCIYELLVIVSIIVCRQFVRKIHNRFILSDILLIFGCVVQILVYALTFVAKSQGSSAMNLIYAATAPTLYVFTIVVLAFPSIYKFVGFLKGYKEFNGDRRNRSRGPSGMFSARVHRFILGY